jgi:serine phosphatase RsbU (regulator of sigma subunit)
MSHIVLADDFGVNRKIFKTFLREMKELVIHEAADGCQVMELLELYDVDLVLLDLIMPRKDGFAVLREMKQHEKYKHIPVIIQSALVETEYITQSLQLGAYDYFHKTLGDSLMENTLVLKVKNAINSYSLHKRIQRELAANYFLQERLNKDLALASLVQKGFLPQEIDSENFCIKTLYRPLHIVSGDLYDYKWDEAKQVLAGYILDISGHGVATALITSALKSLIEQGFEQFHSPQEKIEWLNQSIMPYCCEEFYATIICFEINFNSQLITYASGGIHHSLYISDEKWEFITIPGSPIGLFHNMEFQQYTRRFRDGDSVIFFSDGVADLLERPFVMLDADFVKSMEFLQGLCDTEKIRDDATVVAIHIKEKL